MKPRRRIDKVKLLKKISREKNQIAGKVGPHRDKREKRRKKMTTKDYLEEFEDDDEC